MLTFFSCLTINSIDEQQTLIRIFIILLDWKSIIVCVLL